MSTLNNTFRNEVQRAGQASPCPICSTKSNQCFWPKGDDPDWVHCYKQDGPRATEHTDKQGAPYWRHVLRDDGAPHRNDVERDGEQQDDADDAPAPASSTGSPARAAVNHERALAGADTRHSIYTATLLALGLGDAHQEALRRRGIPADEASRRQYASWTVDGAKRALRAVRDAFGVDEILGCPGFYGTAIDTYAPIERLELHRQAAFKKYFVEELSTFLKSNGVEITHEVEHIVASHAIELVEDRPIPRLLPRATRDIVHEAPMGRERATALVGAVGRSDLLDALLTLQLRTHAPTPYVIVTTVTPEQTIVTESESGTRVTTTTAAVQLEETVQSWMTTTIGRDVRLAGRPGLVIPVRDVRGRISSLLLRPDWPPTTSGGKDDRPKYYPLTGQSDDSAALTSEPHVAMRANGHLPATDVVVVEGPLKADSVQCLLAKHGALGVDVIGLAGVAAPPTLLDVLNDMQTSDVVLAIDSDAAANPAVAVAQATLMVLCGEAGHGVSVGTWKGDLGKGLDDVLVAHGIEAVDLRGGARALGYIRECLLTSSAPPHAGINRYAHLHGLVDRVAQDARALTSEVVRAIAGMTPAASKRLVADLKRHLTEGRYRDLVAALKGERKEAKAANGEAQATRLKSEGTTIVNRGDHLGLADAVSAILSPNREHLRFDEGKLHRYVERTGVWEALKEAFVRKAIAECARTAVVMPLMEPLPITAALVGSTYKLLCDQANAPDFFAKAARGIAFTNGFIKVDTKAKTVTMGPHSADHRVRHSYAFAYFEGANPKRLCDHIRNGVVDEEPEKCVQAVLEFAGACDAGLAPSFRRHFLMRGIGGDGKSVLAEILTRSAPKGSVQTVSPQDMGNEQCRASLVGALYNIAADLPEASLVDTGILKAIMTGDPVQMKKLFLDPFTYAPIAGHYFGCNSAFPVRDVSEGFKDRWMIFDWRRIPVGDRIHMYADLIMEEEQEIACAKVDALRRLVQRGSYDPPKSSAIKVAEWVGQHDSVRSYIDERLVPLAPQERGDKGRWERAMTVYEDYVRHCKATNPSGDPKSMKNFGAQVKRVFGYVDADRAQWERRDANYYPCERTHSPNGPPRTSSSRLTG